MAENRHAVLVISDFHLGAGTASGKTDAFTEDSAFCEFLVHYGQDENLSRLDLVINGDFFDSLEVSLRGELPTKVYEPIAVEKIDLASRGHAEVFAALRHFLTHPGRSITFITGNHDVALAFEGVHALLRKRIGESVAFSQGPIEIDGLRVTHGNEWDAANRFSEDGLLAEDEHGRYVRFPWGSLFVLDYLTRVRRYVPNVDHIKPLGAFMRWAFFHKPKAAWIGLFWFVAFLFKYRFHSDPERRYDFGKLRQIFHGTCYSCDFVEEARREIESSGTQVLVAGHTHRATLVPMGSGAVYANSGTWNQIVHFERGRFSATIHRTYVLAEKLPSTATFNVETVRLLEWIPGKQPADFEPTPFNAHMHPPMRPALLRAAAYTVGLAGVGVTLSLTVAPRLLGWPLFLLVGTALIASLLFEMRRTA